jgi:hypothetical protein
MNDLLDLERYPLHCAESQACSVLIARCKADLAANGMFNLTGLVRRDALSRSVAEVDPLLDTQSYRHARRHNIYFKDQVPGLAADHPALQRVETVNYTLTGDQLEGSVIERIYEWPPLVSFLARVMGKPQLHLMSDRLARLNVLAYRPGEALNWHFDRSQYTVTLLLRAAESGGEFQYRIELRSDADPNYEGVARLLRGEDPRMSVNTLDAGTLNVFAGRNTAHRVTPVGGDKSRIVAVLSYYDTPGFSFSDAERIGFYGRAS